MAEIKTQVSLSDIAEQIAEVVKQNRVNGTYTSLSAAIHKLDLMASAVLSANAGKVDAVAQNIGYQTALGECHAIAHAHIHDQGMMMSMPPVSSAAYYIKQEISELIKRSSYAQSPTQQAIDAGKV